MFVFDLFEKKKQDPAAGRFVGGTSQDARVKNALDNAYRAVPAAKSPEEAALGYIDIQNSLNQKQDQVLSQQNKTNQQQTQQINALVADMRRKEKDFRDLNAQVASMPNVTPQQVAKMAQDIEAAHDSGKDQAVDVPSVISKQTTAQPTSQPAKTVAAPSPGASISQIANFQQSRDQGATTAKAQPAAPQAKPAPTTSRAIGQMASQLATPGRVIKGKNQQVQPTDQTQQIQQTFPDMGTTVTQMPQTPATQQRLAQLGKLGLQTPAANVSTMQKFAEAVSPADLERISTYNNEAFSFAWAHSQSTKLYFGDGIWEDLTFPEVEQIVSAIATDYTEQTRPQVWQQLFSDHVYFDAFKKQHLSQLPLGLKEGDVVPMTDNQTTNQAYADALTFLELVYANPNNPMITTMRQDFAHKYQQRFQISQAPDPDRSYYLLDKQLSKKYKLPTPGFRGLEEDSWHSGDNAWSSEHDQWARESQGMAITNSDVKKKMSKLEALALAANRAGDDAKCKIYQQKIQSLKQKLSRDMAEDRVDPILIKALARMPGGLESHKAVLDAARDAYAMELGLMKMKSDYGVTQAYIPQLLDLYKKKHGLTFNEAETDYQKRRQRERDVDAGKPVARQPRNPQTDYARKRAKARRDLEQFGEGTINYWTRLQNERNTKIASLVDELKESIEK